MEARHRQELAALNSQCSSTEEELAERAQAEEAAKKEIEALKKELEEKQALANDTEKKGKDLKDALAKLEETAGELSRVKLDLAKANEDKESAVRNSNKLSLINTTTMEKVASAEAKERKMVEERVQMELRHQEEIEKLQLMKLEESAVVSELKETIQSLKDDMAAEAEMFEERLQKERDSGLEKKAKAKAYIDTLRNEKNELGKSVAVKVQSAIESTRAAEEIKLQAALKEQQVDFDMQIAALQQKLEASEKQMIVVQQVGAEKATTEEELLSKLKEAEGGNDLAQRLRRAAKSETLAMNSKLEKNNSTLKTINESITMTLIPSLQSLGGVPAAGRVEGRWSAVGTISSDPWRSERKRVRKV